MLRKLLAAWRGEDVTRLMFDEFDHMLDHGHWMFNVATDALMRRCDPASVRDDLMARDLEINELEKSIRGRIVEHLTVQPGADLSGCLSLMSMAKDAERIGDYAKDLFKLAALREAPVPDDPYAGPLDDIRRRVDELFDKTKQALGSDDREAAVDVIHQRRHVSGECGDLIRQLMHEHRETFGGGDLVTYALLAQYYKRTAAHLANVATSVVFPLAELDFTGQVGREDEDDTPGTTADS